MTMKPDIAASASGDMPGPTPEWALRIGLDIAVRHLGEGEKTFAARSALAADIAQELYAIAAPVMGGRAPE